MTDEVAELVLDDNPCADARARDRAPAVAPDGERARALPRAAGGRRDGSIARSSFLPNDKQIVERQAGGTGLTTPEFAVLLASTKTHHIGLVVDSTLPDDPYPRARARPVLPAHPPGALSPTTSPVIACDARSSPLQIGNQMVNMSGISFDHRLSEDSGVGVVDVTRAWVAVRDIFDIESAWEAIESLGADIRSTRSSSSCSTRAS
jgi:glutamate dehydrogenase